MRETFSTPGPIAVDVRVEAGSVDVDALDTETTEVDVEPLNDAAADLVDRVRVELAGDRLQVEAPERQGFRLRGPEFAVRVRCPSGSRLGARSASADVTARGRLGDLEVKSASGDIEVEEAEGEVRVNTASGDVRIQAAHGRAVLNTASGDISIRRALGGVVANAVSGDLSVEELGGAAEVNSVSGDLRLERVGAGPVTFTSVSGDAEIAVVRGADVYLDIRSLSGDTVSELAPSDGPGGEQAVIELRGKTVSGDVRIRSAAS